MSSIVLVNPPLSERARGGNLAAAMARSIPYGLLSLASVLRKAGREVRLVDAMNFAMSTEEAATRILAHDPAYVGVTTATISMGNTAALARELKKRRPELKVLIGGAHISSVPEETMERFPEIDLGVLGEAENTVVELLPALDAKGPLDGVKGLIFRSDGKLVRTGRRPLIEDLDVLPMPAWDLLSNMELYRPSTPSYLRLPSTTIITSRGCAAKCTFCNSRAIFGVKMRSFSADYLLEMVERLQRTYGIRDLSIYDDNFVAFEDRLEKICKTIIDRKLDLTWSCYSRVDQGNEALFRMMKRAGCWQVSYGIESGSQRVLDHIRKGITLAQIDDTLRKTQRAGLRTRGFFMIGHLTDDVASIRETIRFMRKAPLDDFHFTYFTPLPGTPANVVASYMGMLQYPGAVTKLRSGATALLSRIFLS